MANGRLKKNGPTKEKWRLIKNSLRKVVRLKKNSVTREKGSTKEKQFENNDSKTSKDTSTTMMTRLKTSKG